ncbi:MAG: hypothetical protein RLZZ59_444 [Pseudomonadota bacterium]|jgi:lipopolysaccharide transport system permease protein
MKLAHMRKYLLSLIILTRASLVRMNKHSVLGSLWALLQPFVHMCVISYIFSVLLKQPTELMVKNLAATLPLWNFFTLSCNNAAISLIFRENIIKKTAVSSLLFVIADLAVGVLLLLYSLAAMYFFVGIVYFDAISLKWLLTPIIILPFVISVLAFAVIIAFATPYVRDIPQLLQVLLGVMYWTIPIVYPYSIIPESKQIFFDINPLYILIHPLQILMVEDRIPDLYCMSKAILVTLITIFISNFIYKRLKRSVVYYL